VVDNIENISFEDEYTQLKNIFGLNNTGIITDFE
jgi:hypothetical protein